MPKRGRRPTVRNVKDEEKQRKMYLLENDVVLFEIYLMVENYRATIVHRKALRSSRKRAQGGG